MRFRVVFLSTCLLAAAIFCYPSMLLGQSASKKPQPSQSNVPPNPVFRTTVRRVVVDIVVRDSEGKTVHGLTSKDFSIFEDGKPQRILSFDISDFDKPSISLPPDAPALSLNTFVNIPPTPERGPLYVILYDMVNMEMEDQITARKQVLQFIDSKPAGTRFSIWVNSDELHLVQGFTDNKNLLYAALDPKHPVAHVPRSFLLSRNFGAGDTLSTMKELTRLAEFLDGLPGRKNLIWMAGQFPVTLYPTPGDPQDLRDEIKRELDELTRAQVAVYPVNIRGVVINPEGALTGVTPYGGSSSVEPLPVGGSGGAPPAAAGTAPGGTPDRSAAALRTANSLQTSGSSSSLSSGYMAENDVATATGGRAFHSDNDLKAALDEATENGATYYSLSYAPTNPNYNGSLRNIRVALARANCQLQYRRSYYADDPYAAARRSKKNEPDEETPEQIAAEAHERPLYAGLQHGAPLIHQLIFKVRVHALGGPTMASDEQMAKLATQPAFFRGRNKKPKLPKEIQVQKYAIYYLLPAGQIKRTNAAPLPLEFAAIGFDSDGSALNGVFEVASEEDSFDAWPQDQEGNSPSGKTKQPGVYRAMQELFLPAGATTIRAAVRDLSTDRVGAIEIPLPLAPEVEAAESVPSQSAKPD